MTAPLKYNFAAIAAASGNIISAGAQLEGVLSDMDATVRTRLQEAWIGDGGDSYQQMQARWNTAATELRTALAQLGMATGNAGEGMAITNKTNAMRFVAG